MARHVVKQPFDDGSMYEGELSIDGQREGKGSLFSSRNYVPS